MKSISSSAKTSTGDNPPRPGDPVDTLRGIGPARAADLGRIGAGTVGGLLRLFPKEYILPSRKKSIADAVEGESTVFEGELKGVRLVRRGWRPSVVEGTIADGTGEIRALWFRVPYLAKTLKPGASLMLRGTPTGSPLRLLHPGFEVIRPGEESEFSGIVPRYTGIPGLPQKVLRRAIRSALAASGDLVDPIPPDVRRRHGLLPLRKALEAIHAPSNEEAIAPARRRFLFEELFLQQVIFAKRRGERLSGATVHVSRKGSAGRALDRFLGSLPFRLTGDQRRVIGEIRADLESGRVMERLLLGDVGSGKTVVAAAAAVHAVEPGGQAAILVPTEVLARQHAASLRKLLAPVGMNVGLLVSDLPAAAGRPIRSALERGELTVVVGTHALLQESVRFRNLALAVVDEQHRFGVRQRELLPGKGVGAHRLHLSATPIPRSLALTLYGDLDLSVLKESPPGRLPVTTQRFHGAERKKAYAHLKERLAGGEQGFILFPLVEESEKIDLKAAARAYRKLAAGYLGDFRVRLLHGRLPSAERIETLDAFRAGDVDLLVCTTVVEVGVDLPKATVMIVEEADRFGLSQLHQIRGRVGRSDLPSHCFLITRGTVTPQAQKRLAVLELLDDGFRIAEEDLAIRGPGELFGVRQHGHAGIDVAAVLRDPELFEAARHEALVVAQKSAETVTSRSG